MSKKIVNKEFLIGLSVIVAIVILFFGIDYLKGINLFKPANFYIVEYGNVTGLERSAPVTVNGYKVGQVRDISIDYANPDKVKVTLALNRDLRIPEDSYAELSSTLLSGGFVNIHIGTSSRYLPVGSNIRPYAVPDMMAAIQNDVLPAIGSVIPKVDTLLMNLNTLTGDRALLASLQRLDGITDNILMTTRGLETQINGQLPGIMHGARAAVTNIDSITLNLTALSRDLRQLPLQPTMENVHRITANLDKFSASLNNPNSSLSRLTADPQLYNQLNTVAADIDSLIVDIKRNPKRYISIKLL